jgi:hypothetical protein
VESTAKAKEKKKPPKKKSLKVSKTEFDQVLAKLIQTKPIPRNK